MNRARSSSRSKSTRRERRAFSDEFKQEAVRLMQDRRAAGVSVSHVGRELDVTPDQLRAWARQLAVPSAENGTLRSGETAEQEVRRLRRENAVLRQERDFAKKAAVYFAKESR